MHVSPAAKRLKSPLLWVFIALVGIVVVVLAGGSGTGPAPHKAADDDAAHTTHRRADRDAAGRRAPDDRGLSAVARREGLPNRVKGPSVAVSVRISDAGREVRGWVTDIHGDPVMGTDVRLATVGADYEPAPETDETSDAAEADAPEPTGSWALRTGPDGGFAFIGAPTGFMRVTATGPDGTAAAATVPWSEESRTNVTLVLEATATITINVNDPRLSDARVIIRTHDYRAHAEVNAPVSEDLSHEVVPDLVDMEPPMDEMSEDLNGMELAADPDGEVTIEEIAPDEPSEPTSEEARMKRVAAAVEGPLLKWDARDVTGSMGRVFEGVFEEAPELKMMMLMELKQEREVADEISDTELGLEMARMAMEKEPIIGDVMSHVAARFQLAPERGLVALIEDPEFEKEMKAFVEEKEAERRLEAGPEPEIAEEAVGVLEVEPPRDITVAPEEEWVDPIQTELNALRETWGELADNMVTSGTDYEEEASGLPGEPITVRAGFTYTVTLAVDADYHELDCGTATPGAGETLEWTCDDAATATITGVVVDTSGRPVPAATVELHPDDWGDAVAEATSDAEGRFIMQTDVKVSTVMRIDASIELLTAEPVEGPRGQLWAVNVVPGTARDVGTIVIIPSDTADDAMYRTASVRTLHQAADGIFVGDLEADGPLALLGVETGDQLLRIGDTEASHLGLRGATRLLAPEVAAANGSPNVIMRRMNGQTYSLAFPLTD